VTYPLPDGKIEALPDPCPECGAPRVKVIKFRSKPVERCLDPKCPTNYEASVDLGACPGCEKLGLEGGRIMSQRSARTLKRFARCTNYERCQTSYPLPQSGELEPTQERCEPCGSPVVIVHTRKGPWKICIDPNCPSKEGDKKPAARGGARKPTRRKSSGSARG
jgi:DNA topoisomerase-1